MLRSGTNASRPPRGAMHWRWRSGSVGGRPASWRRMLARGELSGLALLDASEDIGGIGRPAGIADLESCQIASGFTRSRQDWASRCSRMAPRAACSALRDPGIDFDDSRWEPRFTLLTALASLMRSFETRLSRSSAASSPSRPTRVRRALCRTADWARPGLPSRR